VNKDNYATLDAGIVLETEVCWSIVPGRIRDYYLTNVGVAHRIETDISAPSMAEVWRELPSHHTSGNNYTVWLNIEKDQEGNTVAKYWSSAINTNPTDALIDLKILLTAQKERV
jgi:hypothetical protein